jgi:ankyrin repeat protein
VKGGIRIKRLILITCVLLVAPTSIEAQEDREKIKDELFSAAENGDFQTLKALLTRHPDMKAVERDGGWTLLHMASNSREMVEYLIRMGVDLEAKSGAYWTPLHSQAYNGYRDGVELLLDHGADIEAKTSFGHTPLLSTLRWDRMEVTELLLKRGANIDCATEMGRTPLIISAIEGHSELAMLLLEHGAGVNPKDKNYQRTALHFAALYGQRDIVAELVEHGADINETDAAGNTPLYYANRYGHEGVARLLKSSGAEEDIDPAHFGPSPYLGMALEEGEAFAWYMGASGYALKTKNHLLLFNYSVHAGAGLPEEPRLANGRIHLDEIADCHTIVFAGSPHHSHHHPGVFREWQTTHKNISFVYSFKDTLGRNPRYFDDVEGPEYTHLPDGEKRIVQGVKVETMPVVSPYGDRGSGFLVEADGLVVFFGGKHLLNRESERESFREPIDTLKGRGTDIDLLILTGNYAWGRIFPVNVEGIDYAVKTLAPRALLVSGGDSTEFVLLEVAAAVGKYQDRTQVFCPDHRGDLFIFTKD